MFPDVTFPVNVDSPVTERLPPTVSFILTFKNFVVIVPVLVIFEDDTFPLNVEDPPTDKAFVIAKFPKTFI
jgi:hypothetical protein